MLEFKAEELDNRRLGKRVHFRDSIQFEQVEEAQFGGSVGFDLSEGGIRMRFNDYIPVGTELSLQIKLNNHNVVECTGRVVWVKKYPYSDHYQAGLQFESPENFVDSRAKIHHYIESFQA